MTFVSDDQQTTYRLKQLEDWLKKCHYPNKIIQAGMKNAKLQGPAPAPKNNNNQLIFVPKYVNNHTHTNTAHQINNMIRNTNSERLNEIFKDCKVTFAHKQPPNLLRLLTKASFVSPTPNEDGNQE